MQHLSRIELHPVSEALHTQCAEGQVMPYLGYICTSITQYRMSVDSWHSCSFLVVTTSQYNLRVLLLIRKPHFLIAFENFRPITFL